jgi:hypothetical protein
MKVDKALHRRLGHVDLQVEQALDRFGVHGAGSGDGDEQPVFGVDHCRHVEAVGSVSVQVEIGAHNS